MIYGKISLEEWQTATVEGDQPESLFESCNLRLFFYGTLYNRDSLQETPDDTNARIAASAFLSDPNYGFSRLDGSFTIVYYSDKESGVVRDHHGTHSPIFGTTDGYFADSWELLQQKLKRVFAYNPVALSAFLQRGVIQKDHFVLKNLLSLSAGEKFFCLSSTQLPAVMRNNDNLIPFLKSESHDDLSEPKEYPNLYHASVFRRNYKAIQKASQPLDTYSTRYGELHRQAIQRRIGTSQQVGILLSGGYDSGSNLAALRSLYDGPIDSYSVGFKGDTWTELPLARLMSDTFGTRHHEYEIDGTEITALPDIVRFLGEPFVEGGLMVNYCAMRMIGPDKPSVILGGDGSDQYFGTTGREVALHYLTARIGMRPLLRGIHGVLSHELFDTGGKLSRINFHLDKILHVMEGERFGFSNAAILKMLERGSQDFVPQHSPLLDTSSFENLYAQHALQSDLEIVINRIILYKASRMARMFDNNLTYPFMDIDLYEFLQNLPVEFKCRGNSVLDIARGRCIAKFLLKHHYKPLLPSEITSKKKQGGFAPMPLFFRDPVQRARIKEFILSSNIFKEYLHLDSVRKFLDEYDRQAPRTDIWFWHQQNRALQYFNLLTLVVWWDVFVEGEEGRF